MIADLEAELRDHPLFRELSSEQRALLFGTAEERRFAPGAFLIREGGPADTLYLLRQGRVALEVHDPAGGALRVEDLGPGELLGWSWLFPPHRWLLDGRALEPVVALAFPAEEVRATMQRDPGLGQHLLKGFLFQVYQRLMRTRLQRLDVYRGPGPGPEDVP